MMSIAPEGAPGPPGRATTSRRRRSLARIATALSVATFAFLYAFRNEGLFHLDAVFLAQAVEDIYAHNRWDTHWRFGAVLAAAIVYFPFWLGGEDAERATILSSLLFHAASIAVAFLFLERLTRSRLLAALAAGLLALAPVYTIANTFGKEYGLAVFLVVTAFHLALGARDAGSGLRAAGSALVFALSYIVWEGLLAITPIYAIALLAPRGERPLLGANAARLAGGALVGFGVGLALDLFTSLHSTLGAYAAGAQMTGFLGFGSPVLAMALRDLARFLGWPFLLASGVGGLLAVRQRRYRMVLPLALPLVTSVAFYGNLSTYGPRYLVLCTLGLCMLAGVTFHVLLTRRPLVRIAATAAYGIALGWMIGASYPLLAARHHYNGAKRFAQLVAEVTEPASIIIVMDDARFVQYYARRATLAHPIGDRAATEIWVGTVRAAMARGPVYLAESGLSYDPGKLVEHAIRANFSLTLAGQRTSEDYHHAEGRLQFGPGRLWRLAPQ